MLTWFFQANSTENPEKNIEKTAKLADFTKISLIGKGTFSFVYMVERNKAVFALKKMNKLFILQEQQLSHVKEEKRILLSLEHPFIIKLYFCHFLKKRNFLIFSVFFHFLHFFEKALHFFSIKPFLFSR